MKMTNELTHCPNCQTELMEAPAIGPFCPNKNCRIGDGPFTVEPRKSPVCHDPGDEDDKAWD